MHNLQATQTTRTFPKVELFLDIMQVVSSIGSGNIIVEFFSAAMAFNVCRYRSCRACGDSDMTSAASLSARDEFISPSAAITYKTMINILLKQCGEDSSWVVQLAALIVFASTT